MQLRSLSAKAMVPVTVLVAGVITALGVSAAAQAQARPQAASSTTAYYRIVDHDLLCLDVAPTRVEQANCRSTTREGFTYVSVSRGTEVKNEKTGKCLEVDKASRDLVVAATCNGTVNEIWTKLPTSSSYVYITNDGFPGTYMHPYLNKTNSGRLIYMKAPINSETYRWRRGAKCSKSAC